MRAFSFQGHTKIVLFSRDGDKTACYKWPLPEVSSEWDWFPLLWKCQNVKGSDYDIYRIYSIEHPDSNKCPSCRKEKLIGAQPRISSLPTHHPPARQKKSWSGRKEDWLLSLNCHICFSLTDPFADVTLWDIYVATLERSLIDLIDNEIHVEID